MRQQFSHLATGKDPTTVDSFEFGCKLTDSLVQPYIVRGMGCRDPIWRRSSFTLVSQKSTNAPRAARFPKYVVISATKEQEWNRYLCASKAEKICYHCHHLLLHHNLHHHLSLHNNHQHPIRGNGSCKPSKLCSWHQNDDIGQTSERINLRPMTRAFAASIPSTKMMESSCKKDVDSFYSF